MTLVYNHIETKHGTYWFSAHLTCCQIVMIVVC